MLSQRQAYEFIFHPSDFSDADLIVMSTDGHRDFLDVLRGNTTERVLHHSPCPLLAVPVQH